jgi:protein MpaA
MDREWSVVARITLLAVLLLGLAGCYEREPKPRITGEQPPLVLPPAQTPPRQRLIGRSVQGRPIFAQIVGQGTETALIMGGIHGDEPAAGALVSELADRLRANPGLLAGRRVVLLPAANPDGLAARTRENARGIDLNRNFDTSNRVDNGVNGLRPLTEPESQALQSVIKEYAPNRIVSVHQPLNCIDYDGPGEAIAARMAQECDLPVKKLGARPGSLGSYTGEVLKIPTITVELPPEASKMSDGVLWQKYGKALIAAILYPEHAK